VSTETLVTVRTFEGPRELRGETLGDELLVVHRTLHGNRDKGAPEWTLTHVPSGHAIIMLKRRADCFAVGLQLLRLLTPAALKAWRSSSVRAVSRRTPKKVVTWIERCRATGRCVEVEETVSV